MLLPYAGAVCNLLKKSWYKQAGVLHKPVNALVLVNVLDLRLHPIVHLLLHLQAPNRSSTCRRKVRNWQLLGPDTIYILHMACWCFTFYVNQKLICNEFTKPKILPSLSAGPPQMDPQRPGASSRHWSPSCPSASSPSSLQPAVRCQDQRQSPSCHMLKQGAINGCARACTRQAPK